MKRKIGEIYNKPTINNMYIIFKSLKYINLHYE